MQCRTIIMVTMRVIMITQRVDIRHWLVLDWMALAFMDCMKKIQQSRQISMHAMVMWVLSQQTVSLELVVAMLTITMSQVGLHTHLDVMVTQLANL